MENADKTTTVSKSELIEPLDLDQLTTERLVEAFNATNNAEPLAEGWPGLERFARKVEQLARTAERLRCWQRINAYIKTGPLPGNGCDETAQRNGMVLATNILAEDLRLTRV